MHYSMSVLHLVPTKRIPYISQIFTTCNAKKFPQGYVLKRSVKVFVLLHLPSLKCSVCKPVIRLELG